MDHGMISSSARLELSPVTRILKREKKETQKRRRRRQKLE
jgi:hypothetical protein